MSVENFIKDNVSKLSETVYIAPEIPEKKLNNAVQSISDNVDPNYVLAVVDSSIFKNGKEGCVFLGNSFYSKTLLENAIKIEYKDIESAERIIEETVKDNGKITKTEAVAITLKDKTIKKITGFMREVNYVEIAELLNGIVNIAESEDDYKITNQRIPLSDLSSETQVNYVKIICNFAFINDGKIDSLEYSEIMALMARNKMDKDARLTIRQYMFDEGDKVENELLINELESLVESSSISVTKQSLMKDVLYIFSKNNDPKLWKDNEFILNLERLLQISDQQVEIFLESIQRDKDILNKRSNDTEIEKSLKDLSANAVAVGVPLAAIYFSGSVVGMSAAGLTSGLATLGMGGLLGFSGMVSGIGIAILLGVGSYKGVKKLTGISDLENNKQREFMLQEIIKNQQQTINYIIEDINEISNSLMIAIRNMENNNAKIEKLTTLLKSITNAAKISSENLTLATREQMIAKLPRTLDVIRLKELTSAPTLKELGEIVETCYEEKIILMIMNKKKYN
ncbi:hypothetical protein [Aerococcus sp. 1KP-2016]|uniref:hypothetical protein n=1 Tax=Aerococcus sp. 1KP-2016 TaxID=1981982 RepID=UPI000B98A25C|nr:hypothetical protein [Aerococcus sp. 1KP-2016]OYQ68316.1 hypothetical protein B9P78_00470 [Aerococcus sp. 1KP-2016]